MDGEFMNRLVELVATVIRGRCSVQPVPDGGPRFVATNMAMYELVGFVGFAGVRSGNLLIAMSRETGSRLLGDFLCESVDTHQQLVDGLSKVLSTVSTVATYDLDDYELSFFIPTIVLGKEQQLIANAVSPWLIVPMMVPSHGPIALGVVA